MNRVQQIFFCYFLFIVKILRFLILFSLQTRPQSAPNYSSQSRLGHQLPVPEQVTLIMLKYQVLKQHLWDVTRVTDQSSCLFLRSVGTETFDGSLSGPGFGSASASHRSAPPRSQPPGGPSTLQDVFLRGRAAERWSCG